MNLPEYLYHNDIDFKTDIDLKQFTGINGGTCSYFCQPKTINQLQGLITFANNQDIRFEISGNFTNTFYLQNYNPFLIISTLQVNNMIVENDCIICDCGCNLTKLGRYCVKNGIAGYEGFIGIPGTIGAAAINNSGAYSSEMAKIVKYVEILTADNLIKRLESSELEYQTRSSILKHGMPNTYLLRVAVDISSREDITSLEEKAELIKRKRQNTVDGKRKSLGSVFVSSSLKAISNNNKFKIFLKRICFSPFKIILGNKAQKSINTFFDFLFLGIPQYARHCDSLNRFCWDKDTTESDFLGYINAMQKLANNQLKLEIQIKGSES